MTENKAGTKMMARLVCRNVREKTDWCGHTWILEDDAEITDEAVKVKVEDDEGMNNEL